MIAKTNTDELNNVVIQLVDIYINDEYWHRNKLSVKESTKYFKKLVLDGNIFFYQEKKRVLGYCEFWRLDFEQWGRYVCGQTISPFDEDITLGNVCVVHNVWINKEYRRSYVTKWMIKMFYKLNSICDYYVGHALRKSSSQPIKVFKRSDLKSSIFIKGE